METPIHTINTLFEQLGLDNTDEAIDVFINQHRPIPGSIFLYDADFWSPAQAAFLREAVNEDADWAEVVDQLDTMLRD